MMFRILAPNCNSDTKVLLDNYKQFNKADVEVAYIQSNELDSFLEKNIFHLVVLDEKELSNVKIAKKYNINSVVLCDKQEANLMLAYQYGASLYINNDNFAKVYQFILDQFKEVIDQIVLNNKKIDDLINLESLTQLPNRSKLIQTLQSHESNIIAIAILDINSFKEINDFYGHQVGDFILKGVANLISSEIKPYKELQLYKFPSDTYCITNDQLDQEQFSQIIKKILDKIETISFVYQKNDIHLRATAGISFSKKQNKLITADLALQAAKKSFKDYEVFYEDLDNLKEYQNNMLWTKKIKHALNKDNIIVYFQPLINNHTLKVEKYECLVRLIDDSDNEKVVSPFFFLDISKKSKQYNKITKTVLEKSIKTFADLSFEFSINISYDDISNPDFYAYLEQLLKEYPQVASHLVFEILENESIKNYDIVIDFISKVKALGCKIALDDFGSGYSNFDNILKMDADYLKIDASLIKNITTDRNSYLVTKTVTQFAKELGLKTIAEYVENEDIFKIVQQLGIDYSQGYYFSPPVEKPNDSNQKGLV